MSRKELPTMEELLGVNEVESLKGMLQLEGARNERLRARIAELEARAPVAVTEDGWLPIETAPQDGSWFLTWDSHYGIRRGKCHVRPDHDDWLSYGDSFNGSSKGGIRATHWMPLPPAPSKGGDS